MRHLLGAWLGLLALAFVASTAIATPIYIDDPGKYADEIMRLVSNNDTASVSKMISDSVGKPSYAENLQNALNALTSKKIDYTDKVIDNTFGKSLRQIIYYGFLGDIGFVYFRFNFKMSGHGWILANFNFKTENPELFPNDFVTPKN